MTYNLLQQYLFEASEIYEATFPISKPSVTKIHRNEDFGFSKVLNFGHWLVYMTQNKLPLPQEWRQQQTH